MPQNEKCYQCKRMIVEGCPIVVVLAEELIADNDKDSVLYSGLGMNGKAFSALGICAPCHQTPRVKGHFFPRKQMIIATRSAGSDSIGV